MQTITQSVGLLIFDLEDTLCNFTVAQQCARQKISWTLEQADINPHEFWAAYPIVKARLMQKFYQGYTPSQPYQWLVFAQTLAHIQKSVGVLPDTLMDIYYEETITNLKLFEDVPSVLSELSVRGYKLAILVNGSSAVKRARIKNLNLYEWFEPKNIFISEEICAYKPQRESYLCVLNAFGLQPEEALMIGDSLTEDIAEARSLGMEVALIERYHTNQNFTLNHNSITSLEELLTLLETHPLQPILQSPQNMANFPQWM